MRKSGGETGIENGVEKARITLNIWCYIWRCRSDNMVVNYDSDPFLR